MHKKTYKGLRQVLSYLKGSQELEIITGKVNTINNNLTEAVRKIKVKVNLPGTIKIARQDNKWTLINEKDSFSPDFNTNKIINQVLSLETVKEEILVHNNRITNALKLTATKNKVVKVSKPINERVVKKESASEDFIDITEVIRVTNGSKITLSIIKDIIKKHFQTLRRANKEVVKAMHERGNSVKLVTAKGTAKPFSVITVKGETLRRSLIDYSTPKNKGSYTKFIPDIDASPGSHVTFFNLS